jgi:hypothetical protein
MLQVENVLYYKDYGYLLRFKLKIFFYVIKIMDICQCYK